MRKIATLDIFQNILFLKRALKLQQGYIFEKILCFPTKLTFFYRFLVFLRKQEGEGSFSDSCHKYFETFGRFSLVSFHQNGARISHQNLKLRVT